MSKHLVVDSGEKEYYITLLEKYNVPYVVEEIKLYYCMDCNKVYKDFQEKCDECDGFIESEKVGDLTDNKRSFVIERKKDSNLYSSIHNNELYDQLNRMQQFFDGNTVLLFEGNLTRLAKENQDRYHQIMSIPATCMQYGISFIQLENPTTTVMMAKYFLRKAGTKPKLRLRKHSINKMLPKTVQLLMGIKGIGRKTALNIYEKYSHITQLGLALYTGKIEKISGVGPKTQELLRKWLCDE